MASIFVDDVCFCQIKVYESINIPPESAFPQFNSPPPSLFLSTKTMGTMASLKLFRVHRDVDEPIQKCMLSSIVLRSQLSVQIGGRSYCIFNRMLYDAINDMRLLFRTPRGWSFVDGRAVG